jgi:hypothetical protein
MKDLARRLLRLEGGTPSDSMVPDPEAARGHLLQTSILACNRGGYDGHEALASAHARAIGYEDFQAYKRAFVSPGFEVIERHNAAWADLLAEHGMNPTSSSEETEAFLERMLERVPERIQEGIVAEYETLKRLNAKPL